MTWGRERFYLDENINEEEIICNYTDTYNIVDDNVIKHFSYKTKIVDFIQYVDNMLGISTTASNVFDMLNIYEDDAFLDDPIKSTAYGKFVKSLYYATKTL